MMKIVIWFVFSIVYFTGLVSGHGRMIQPAMRGSMWRFPDKYPEMLPFPDYNDMSLNAGGPSLVRANYPILQYGVCGDPHTNSKPRAHESGGRFGKFNELGLGAIAKCYTPGSSIDIQIDVTAHHKGYFSFDLCVPGLGRDEDEECFTTNGYLLQQTNGNGPFYNLPDNGNGVYSMKYDLPPGVTCDQGSRCILRWYWLTGNSFAEQNKEEFWNCADIQISNNCGVSEEPTPSSSVYQTPTPTQSPAEKTEEPSASSTPVPSASSTTSVSPSVPVVLPTNTPPVSTSPSQPPPTPSSLITPSNTPSSVVPGGCSCNEGWCPTGVCDNCLQVYGADFSRRACHFGWSKWHCDSAGSGYTWCGA